jgi:non-heme chloroperoxidase
LTSFGSLFLPGPFQLWDTKTLVAMMKYIVLMIGLFISGSTIAQVVKYRRFQGMERSVELPSGIELQYVEQGDATGIPVILLHGFTDSWHSYETVLPYLSSGMHVLAITQRGHGNSGKPAAGYHPKDFAADVAAFMKQQKIGAAFIAGHSMGGMIAQQFALDFPELVKGLVIIGSDASFKDNPGVPEFSEEINKLSNIVGLEFADGFQRSTCAHPVDPAYYKVLVGESMKVPGRVWKAAMNGMMEVDLTSQLNRIQVPVLILWGSKDGFCTRADQDAMVREIPNTKFIIYEDTGHAMHWEEPKRFATDLNEFIKHTQQISN